MLQAAINEEVGEYLALHAGELDEHGRRLVVRNGRAPKRGFQTGVGSIEIQRSRINDRRLDEDGNRIRFSSSVLPGYLRRTKVIEDLIPWLDLKGVSTGDFSEALGSLLGQNAAGLTAATIVRLKKVWEEDFTVAHELVGDKPTGVVISDRYSGYLFIDLDQRQVCFAHLIRDFRRMAEGEKDLRWIGERLLGLTQAVFRLWHLFQDGEIERTILKRWSRQLRNRMIRLLDQEALSHGYETPRMCRGILRTEPAMWTFVECEWVEPTNNAAELAVRPVVIHRKTSLGSQSESGSRFIERMQIASATLRQKGRSLNDFIVNVAHAVLGDKPSPKLLG